MDGKLSETEAIPHSPEAERGVLGSLFFADAAVWGEVQRIMQKEDFFLPYYAELYGVMCDILAAHKPMDVEVIVHELRQRGLLESVGGLTGVADVMLHQPGVAAARHYAEIVRETSMRRRVIAFAESLRRKALAPSRFTTGDDIAQEASSQLLKIITTGRRCEDHSIGQLLMAAREQIGKGGVPLVKTGFRDLDNLVGGVGIGEMLLIGARPSMGKSTLLRQLAIQCAQQGDAVGFISLEEGGTKMARNWMSMECGIENQKIRTGNLAKHEWDEIDAGILRMKDLPIYVTDKSRRMGDIRATTTVWKSRFGIRVLLIDYMQRISGVSGTSRYEIVSNTSTEVSDLFKENEVAGIVAVQLNRAVEGREDKRPGMSDIRESGQIEQDADGIIFLHREDYYHLDDPNYQPNKTAELILAKWRDGVRGEVVKLRSKLSNQKFTDIDPDEVWKTPDYSPDRPSRSRAVSLDDVEFPE